jgi:alanyl-tRNA synthetase
MAGNLQPMGLGEKMSLPPIDLPFFQEHGLARLKCEVSGLFFWARDHERTTCGDTAKDEYTFIGNPLIKGFETRGKELKDGMRKAFLDYFEQRQHTVVNPYPVLARWRDDIHLTIASIADFQPHITSGLVEPPANPLTISQPCIRLTDVDAVGRSGRHLTTFEMMAHHVFNRPGEGQTFYWMNECVEFCDDLLVNVLGIDANEITYVENPWSGGGNAGPAVEVIVGGLELATLVFMSMEEHPDGEVEIKGLRYREMPLQIIDTGYGLERFCWAAAGTPTIYEAIYPESVAWLKQLSDFDGLISEHAGVDLDNLLGEISKLMGIMNIEIGSDEGELLQTFISRLADNGVTISEESLRAITRPLSSIYAIPDHMHALCHMLGDGLVPSNAKAGYLARMLARRVLRMRDDLGLSTSLVELGEHHLDVNLPGAVMTQTREGLLSILALEEERYTEMLRKGENVVRNMLREVDDAATELDDEILFTLNDTHGISPELVIQIARRTGMEHVNLRTGFAAELAARHAQAAKIAAQSSDVVGMISVDDQIPPTVLSYYEDVDKNEFSSEVLACFPLTEHESASHAVVLAETCFYPEGGGQECDLGVLTSGGKGVSVVEVSKESDWVIHYVDGELAVNDSVKGEIDAPRRHQLMDHHTSVHIVGGAARQLLGPHIFQAGSNVTPEYSRLDITHPKRLTREDLNAIEDMSNQAILQVGRTEKIELNRRDADAQFGFDLYQGGAPKGADIRILKIGDHDIQACGGTHHDDLSRIGEIRIIRSTAVQDGVERLHIVSGEAEKNYSRQQDAILRQTCEVFGVNDEDLPKTALRFFDDWKSQRKKIEHLEAEITRLRTSGSGGQATENDGVRIIVLEGEGDLRQLQGMAGELTREKEIPTVAVIGSTTDGGFLLVAITEDTVASERYNAVEILQSISHHIGGGGGGRPTFAQGGGSNPDGLEAALSAARELLN